MIGLATDLFFWLTLAQLLHAVTFGVHHSASMKYLHEQFGDASVSRAMSLYTMVAYGFGATAGGLFYAWLWSAAGSVSIFWAAAAAACLGLMCCWKMNDEHD
jgi:MFS transporter, PPP family, 3-phenylpropionic acid transporter